MNKFLRFCKNVISFMFKTIISFAIVTIIINLVVIGVSGSRIIDVDKAAEMTDVDCIIVLGCSVVNGKPSPMLAERLNKCIELYNAGASEIVLMSGDNMDVYYNEVGAMKEYAVDAGISSENIFLDHAGYSTYDSMYRLKEIFGAKKVVIVTQKYHLYRAVYLANMLGIDAYGVSTESTKNSGHSDEAGGSEESEDMANNSSEEARKNRIAMEVREVLARDKDFIAAIIKPESTVMGERVELTGDGNRTN